MQIRTLRIGDRVEGYALVKQSEVKTSTKGGKYLDMVLGDKSGEIDAKYWDYQEGATPEYPVNSMVKVRGSVNEFRGALQLRVEMIRPLLPSDHVNPEDYVTTSEYDPALLYNEIIRIAQGFSDEDLKNLLLAVYDAYRSELLVAPAAVSLHHAMRGGLLYHTLSIIRMCRKAAEVYPQIDEDLLVCGAALHDLGKIREMDFAELGIASQYTTDGNLIGHLVRGAMMVEEIGKELNTPADKLRLIEHMLISHHGKPEYGAAVQPKFLEALVLARMDELDATIYEVNDCVSKLEPETFSPRLWSLDNTRLYHHGRKNDLEPHANLLPEDEE